MWGAYLFLGVTVSYCLFVLWYLFPHRGKPKIKEVMLKDYLERQVEAEDDFLERLRNM